ncbi:G5 domain-containing protein, partial [Bifidobacterium bifidum]|nr:G5 domain-containing protein [Bifidobacterium bifidum]
PHSRNSTYSTSSANTSNSGNKPNSGNSFNSGNSGNNGNSGNSGNSGSSSQGRLWHPTAAQAKAYASGAAAQRGWTSYDWTCLDKLWTRESRWLWYAENAKTGAYGIPQSLPASKMAEFGANYRDDGAVQIDWGLAYIARRYGSPSKAWERSEQIGWY